MRCPTLTELPPPPPGKTGWPWTEESRRVPETTPDGRPWPRVSIVTPSYNQARFIEETLRSVLLQGYPDLEYIIIDGGSTDGSVEVIRRYEKWLTFWVSEPDRGQAHAINKGFSRATGEIVAWINSDDFYCREALHRASQFLMKNSEVGMVYGRGYYVNEYGKIWRLAATGPFDLSKVLCRDHEIVQPTAFMRRAAVQKAGMMDETLHYAIDDDLWIKIGAAYRVGFIPAGLACAREHSNAKTVAQAPEHMEEERLIRERYFSNNPDLSGSSKSRIFSRIFFWKAYGYFFSGQMRESRRWLRRSVAARPSWDSAGPAAYLFLKTLLGRRLVKRLRPMSRKIRGGRMNLSRFFRKGAR